MDAQTPLIAQACAALGGQAEVARLLAVTPPAVNQWCKGLRLVPADRCPDIERATRGAFSCEELRPDVRWRRVKDLGWPWHVLGKPLIDVATPEPSDGPAEPTDCTEGVGHG